MQRHSKHLSTITRLPRMFLFIGIPSFTKFLIELKFSISIFSIQIFLLFFLHPQMLVLLIQSLNFTVFRCELSTTVVNVKCVSFTRWPFILFLSKSAGTRTEVANYSDHIHERKNQEIQKKKQYKNMPNVQSFVCSNRIRYLHRFVWMCSSFFYLIVQM